MQNYIKIIISALQKWTKKEIKASASDWTQNDPSVSGYIKNRTHWEELDFVNLKTQNIDFSSCQNVSWGQPKTGYLYEFIFGLKLVPGKNYNIIFDGKTYSS